VATITERIHALLAAHRVDAEWRHRAVELANATTPRAAFEQHPMLKRLRELDEGWLDKPRGIRLETMYPSLAGLELAKSIELELADEDTLDGTGPFSDFDPLNSVYLASIPYQSIWYSLVCLPGEPITRWPVIQCDPSAGDDSEITVAVNFEHFIHQWMCRDGPYFLSPLAEAAEDVAAEIIRAMGAVFRINTKEASNALRHTRNGSDSSDEPSLAPYVDAQTLRRLDTLMVKPS